LEQCVEFQLGQQSLQLQCQQPEQQEQQFERFQSVDVDQQ